MKGPTERQLQVVRFIASHLNERGFPPSIREICAAMGFKSTNAASDVLGVLERKALVVRRVLGQSRGVALTDAAWNLLGSNRPKDTHTPACTVCSKPARYAYRCLRCNRTGCGGCMEHAAYCPERAEADFAIAATG